MKNHLFPLLLATIALPALAQEATPQVCDGKSAIERVEIETGKEKVDAQLCQQGDEVVIVTDKPVRRQHLLYGGLNLGLPYMGLELSYVQKKDERQVFHISSALEGSVGANGIDLRGGYHPWGNALFIGGTARGYQGLPGEGGFQAGPTIGLSTGGRIISGHVGLSFLAGYDSRVEGMAYSPEFVIGLRIRLLKTPRK